MYDCYSLTQVVVAHMPPMFTHSIRKSFPMVPVFLLMLFDEFQILFTPYPP
ncbi:BnaA05g17130D [Brassica napus]|uniref:BnaA05g17130D protein n=1 Tax=Brassica napus TaxID=3708 RepID=A0A078FCH0_BRANA|nr:BnaA05g17130D [Brassica napus]